MTHTSPMAWTHKVVKQMRGLQGEWFDFPTAGTFSSEAEAKRYAEDFAREQAASGVAGARITVRSRRKVRGTYTIAVYRSGDYVTGTAADIESEDEE